jgi:hypothetical protein
MENNKAQLLEVRKELLDEMRMDDAKEQKFGIHFMLASIPIWIAICIIQKMEFSAITKNLLVFCFATPLVPLAYVIAKLVYR